MDNSSLESATLLIQTTLNQLKPIVLGQSSAIQQSLVAILTNNHALLEGVPGVGKTLLVRALAQTLGCDFSRVQFTPDLMPSDIIGTNVFNMKSSEFQLVKGPIFTSFLLADEINRSPAKTQSALLQAMQERLVTIDNTTHSLPNNFCVFATQNPQEYEGTYPLPEAQKDRFLLKIQIHPLESNEEKSLAHLVGSGLNPMNQLDLNSIKPTLLPDQLQFLKQLVFQVTLKEDLLGYIVDLIRATRNHDGILIGAGPRATLAMVLASKAYALIQQRDFVTPDDIQVLLSPILTHRIQLKPEYEMDGFSTQEVISQICTQIAIPR
jgi:MoxR-like ATPase